MKEVFKDIKGYEEIYQVSDLGNVRSLDRQSYNGKVFHPVKGRVLKQTKGGVGYLTVKLSKNGVAKTKNVHQLVALAFLGHIPNKYCLVIDHIDNNKENNSANNLQLITPRENTSKDRNNGVSKYTGVFKDKNSSKWRASIKIGDRINYLGSFDNECDASIAYQNKLKSIS